MELIIVGTTILPSRSTWHPVVLHTKGVEKVMYNAFRTQNRIKNRFYGTIRNYIRMVSKTLCLRHSAYNTEISKISPSLLNDLYNS